MKVKIAFTVFLVLLVLYPGYSQVLHHYSTLIGNWSADAIEVDDQGNKWLGFGGGLLKYDGENWTSYTEEDGLVSNFVKAIAIDQEGNIWIGTNPKLINEPPWTTGGGVSMFDGSAWTSYTKSDGLANNDVDAIAIDHSGNIWFKTFGGMSRFDGENWTSYPLQVNRTAALTVDNEGMIWVGSEKGVSKFDGENWTSYNITDGEWYKDVLAIAADHEGNIWFGTTNMEAIRFDGENWTSYSREDGINNAESAAIDHEGNVWFGTYEGLAKFDEEKWYSYPIRYGIRDVSVESIGLDTEGSVWFSTYYGLYEFDGNHWTNISLKSLASNEVLSVAIDDMGNKWFGTDKGLSKFDGVNWTTYPLLGEAGKVVYHDSCLWVLGTFWYWENTGFPYIIKYDGDNWHYFTGDSVPDKYLHAFQELDNWTHFANEEAFQHSIGSSSFDQEGNLWIGSYGKIFKFDGEQWTSPTVENNLPSSTEIYEIAFDLENNIWIATEDGLYKYDGENWTNYPFEAIVDFLNVYIYSMAIDKEGNVWIGTNAGVSFFDGENWTSFTTKDGLVSNNVRVIEVDDHGNIWIGTYDGGVSRYDGDTWTTYIEIDPQPYYNFVSSFAFEDEGYIWIGTYGNGVITVQEPSSVTAENKPMIINNNDVTIFPNPVTELITIEPKVQGAYTIAITSVNGQRILKKKFDGNRNYIDLSSFPNGFYFITIRSKDFVTTRKILKL